MTQDQQPHQVHKELGASEDSELGNEAASLQGGVSDNWKELCPRGRCPSLALGNGQPGIGGNTGSVTVDLS